ncbi:MAG: sporulation protein YabP [Firmicutes bacterium]|nr:sporulation protein YabP [Alicyclobacillaceae bacterium]MCL6497202.1 sporulation protein YabP [Bacillota bacterium]
MDAEQHAVRLTDRKWLEIDGVEHVDSFDDDSIVLVTRLGRLVIRGHDLRIHQLDLEKGHFSAAGTVDGMTYTQPRKGGEKQKPLRGFWR